MDPKTEINILVEEASRYVSERHVLGGMVEHSMAVSEALSTPGSRDEILRRVDRRISEAIHTRRNIGRLQGLRLE